MIVPPTAVEVLKARGEPARLEDYSLPVAEQTVLEQHLRHLGGLARPSGRLQHEPLRRLECGDDVVFEVINGQPFGHGPIFIRKPMSGYEAKSAVSPT